MDIDALQLPCMNAKEYQWHYKVTAMYSMAWGNVIDGSLLCADRLLHITLKLQNSELFFESFDTNRECIEALIKTSENYADTICYYLAPDILHANETLFTRRGMKKKFKITITAML